MLDDPDEDEEPEEDEEEPEEEDEPEGDDEEFEEPESPEEVVVFVRSREVDPESRCCTSVASTAELLGAVVPKAQIMFCCVSELAAMVYPS